MSKKSIRLGGTLMPILLVALLTACGGGGGGVPQPPPATASLSGTAAIGAALVGATVTVVDRTGASVCTNTPQPTSDTGAYSCTLSAQSQAPFAISVIDPAGLVAPMVSILANKPAAGATTTANVTPLTTAIAAQLDPNKDAFALVNNPGALAGLDTVALAVITTNVVAQLAPVLQALGVDVNTFDPMQTPFVGGSGAGADQLLDQVRVSFDGGSPQLSNVLNPDAPSVPLAGTSTTSVSTVSVSAVTTAFSISELDFAKTEMERCFAVPSATRAPNPDTANRRLMGVNAACENFVASAGDAPNVDIDFKHNGYDPEAFFYGLLTDPDMDGAQFNRPELMRYVQRTDGRDEALLNIKFSDKNGFPGNRVLTAKKFPGSRTSGTQWWLIGNQRLIDAYIQVAMSRRDQNIPPSILNASTLFDNAPRSRYEVGFNIFVQRPNNGGTVNGPNNPNNAIRYVRVTGPGLPVAGMVYGDVDPVLPQSWMSILNVTGAIPNTSTPQLAGNVGNIFRVQRTRGVTGTEAFTLRPNAGAGALAIDSVTQAHPLMYGLNPDANWIFDVSSVPAWSIYRFEVFCGTDPVPCHDFNTRITTPLVPASFLASQAWHSFTAASLAAVSDGALAADSALIAWSPNVLAERVSSVNAYSWSPLGNVNSPSAGVPPAAFSRTVNAVGGQFPALSFSSNQSGRQLQLRYLTLDGGYKDHYSRFN